MSSQAEPTKYYWIDCSGDGYMSMSEHRLETLLSLMPTLRFLLFGHPRMKPKDLKELEDGTQIIEIPRELEVSKNSFILLVNCVLEVEPLPPRGNAIVDNHSRLTELVETMAILGGCEVLESRLRGHSANPMNPEEDTDDKFTWHIMHQSTFRTIDRDEMKDLANAGFSFTMRVAVKHESTYYYRKEKQRS